ncbi:hypothetical protein PO124_21405 [Bacillus licheniformis]|nr:hypothetical protein [Bacillus licheniformis]
MVIPKDLEDAAKSTAAAVLPRSSASFAYQRTRDCRQRSGFFLFTWGDLIYSMTFNRNQELWPLTAGIYNVISQYGIQWNDLMAFAVYRFCLSSSFYAASKAAC